MSVEIIIPKTIRAVWALRLGIFRSPIFSMTRLRTAMKPMTATTGKNIASRTYMIHSILTPKRSSIRSSATTRHGIVPR